MFRAIYLLTQLANKTFVCLHTGWSYTKCAMFCKFQEIKTEILNSHFIFVFWSRTQNVFSLQQKQLSWPCYSSSFRGDCTSISCWILSVKMSNLLTISCKLKTATISVMRQILKLFLCHFQLKNKITKSGFCTFVEAEVFT